MEASRNDKTSCALGTLVRVWCRESPQWWIVSPEKSPLLVGQVVTYGFLEHSRTQMSLETSPRAATRDCKIWYKLGPLEAGSYIIPPCGRFFKEKMSLFSWNFFSCVPDTIGGDFLGRHISIYFCRWMGFLNVCWSTLMIQEQPVKQSLTWIRVLSSDTYFIAGVLKLRGEVVPCTGSQSCWASEQDLYLTPHIPHPVSFSLGNFNFAVK